MDKLLDIISKWDRLGQGIFLFLMACLAAVMLVAAFHFLNVLVHGWPPEYLDEAEEEDS